MKAQKEFAAYLRLGLVLGTHRVTDIVSWADEIIEATEIPSIEVMELALMRDAHPIDVEGKLGEIAGVSSPIELLPSVLADAHQVLRQDISFGPILARGLYSLYVQCDYDVPESVVQMSCFEDAYLLADSGTYGTADEVYRQLLDFTGGFRNAV